METSGDYLAGDGKGILNKTLGVELIALNCAKEKLKLANIHGELEECKKLKQKIKELSLAILAMESGRHADLGVDVLSLNTLEFKYMLYGEQEDILKAQAITIGEDCIDIGGFKLDRFNHELPDDIDHFSAEAIFEHLGEGFIKLPGTEGWHHILSHIPGKDMKEKSRNLRYILNLDGSRQNFAGVDFHTNGSNEIHLLTGSGDVLIITEEGIFISEELNSNNIPYTVRMVYFSPEFASPAIDI